MHLTYPDSDTHTGAVSTANAGEAGAPESEIEVTPEMMAAGAEVLRLQFDSLIGDDDGHYPRILAETIFRSMAVLAPERCRRGT